MFNILLIVMVALEVNGTLVEAKVTKNLTDDVRLEYSVYIAEASVKYKIDPLIIAAVIYGESRFQNLRKNKTRDYGIMQVHWQRRAWTIPWLKKLKRADLYDIATNINAGTWELTTWRTLCRKRGHKAHQHKWWGHYQQGNVIKSRRYGRAINYFYHRLKRYRTKYRTRNKT